MARGSRAPARVASVCALASEDLLAIWTTPPELKDANKQHKAAAIARRVEEQAAELEGIRDPVAQARAKVAQETGHASGPALDKWIRRNR